MVGTGCGAVNMNMDMIITVVTITVGIYLAGYLLVLMGAYTFAASMLRMSSSEDLQDILALLLRGYRGKAKLWPILGLLVIYYGVISAAKQLRSGSGSP